MQRIYWQIVGKLHLFQLECFYLYGWSALSLVSSCNFQELNWDIRKYYSMVVILGSDYFINLRLNLKLNIEQCYIRWLLSCTKIKFVRIIKLFYKHLFNTLKIRHTRLKKGKSDGYWFVPLEHVFKILIYNLFFFLWHVNFFLQIFLCLCQSGPSRQTGPLGKLMSETKK